MSEKLTTATDSPVSPPASIWQRLFWWGHIPPLTADSISHMGLWMAVTSSLLSALCVTILLGVIFPRQDRQIRIVQENDELLNRNHQTIQQNASLLDRNHLAIKENGSRIEKQLNEIEKHISQLEAALAKIRKAKEREKDNLP